MLPQASPSLQITKGVSAFASGASCLWLGSGLCPIKNRVQLRGQGMEKAQRSAWSGLVPTKGESETGARKAQTRLAS